MKHIKQPDGSKLCSHCCIAMIRGITLDAAIALVGHERAMRNREVIAALGDFALTSSAVLAPKQGALPDPSILRIRIKETMKHHNVVLHGGIVYDSEEPKTLPLYVYRAILLRANCRIVAVFPVQLSDSEVHRG